VLLRAAIAANKDEYISIVHFIMIKPVMICAKRRALQILRRQASHCIEQAPAAFTKLATHCCQPLHAPSDASRPRHKTPQDVTNTSIDSGISPPPPAAATAAGTLLNASASIVRSFYISGSGEKMKTSAASTSVVRPAGRTDDRRNIKAAG